ncbi:MAG: GNAT family N-acetyltransferase [Alphaproteobacteria bacterium]|nr:GNAT family N-acetyltransferase [Alphaproteobacteria bacterium]
MLKYMENLYEIRNLRKNVCHIKNSVMYSKWTFPTANGSFNPTYIEKLDKQILEEILFETQNYQTILQSPKEDLDKNFPDVLETGEEIIVYGLEQKTPFLVDERLTLKLVKNKTDLLLWGRIASQIYSSFDADFIYASFKKDLKKDYATYFIVYKDKVPVAVSQIIRGGGYSAVYWVGVLEKHRGAGLGKELTKLTLNYEIQNHRYKFLLTASEQGLKIYEKLGFKPVEKFYNYKFK